MLWIKRNLFLFVGGIIAAGLLVVGVLYLLNGIQDNNGAQGKLEESKAELTRLVNLVPSATPENITKAHEEQKELQRRMNDTKKSFTPISYEKATGPAFKALLDQTIDDLQKKADRASVSLPLTNHYAFTFAEQQRRLQFSEGSFPTLTEQLGEIKAICQILFDAKINKLTGLRRGRVTTDDPAGASDYHELPPNRLLPSGATVSPYALEFISFSSELAAVLEGFYKSPNGMLVKAVEVKPVEELPAPAAAQPMNPVPLPLPPLRPPPNPGDPNPLQPRRLPPNPNAPGPVPVPPQRTVPRVTPGTPSSAGEGMVTVLDEKKLRINLWVDVLKPPVK